LETEEDEPMEKKRKMDGEVIEKPIILSANE
jgi:hypothetical protein